MLATEEAPRTRLDLKRMLQGPRLQLLNLSVFLTVVVTTLDFPTPLWTVVATVATAGTLDATISRWRFGEWRIPWPSLVGATGACLLVDGIGLAPFLALAVLMVASKHLIRWRERHLFNPNNFAVAVLLLAGVLRIGVNEWGAAPQALGLIILFGTIATTRVKRFDLAVGYLATSVATYAIIAAVQGWSWPTVVAFAFSPLQVMLGFFAITDPATSPGGRVEKLVYILVLVALAVPATLAGRAEAPVFALLAAAPQRHLIAWGVRRLREGANGGAPAGGPA